VVEERSDSAFGLGVDRGNGKPGRLNKQKRSSWTHDRHLVKNPLFLYMTLSHTPTRREV